MASLPTNNSDNNAWGAKLNTWLEIAHNSDGTVNAAPGNLSGITSIKEGPTNPLRYGAAGDGITLDDTAMQAMFASLASGGHAYFPPGYLFRTSQPLTLVNGIRVEGPGAGPISIVNAASDIFNVAASGTLYNIHMHDIGVNSASGGGHIINATAGATVACSQFNHLYLQQDNAAKSNLTVNSWLDNTFEESFLYGGLNRSVPVIQGISTTDNLSDNRFHNLRITDQGTPTTWAVWWEEASTALAFGNVFEEINFENPVGGAITVRGQWGYKLSGLYLWDLSASSANDLVAPRKSVGFQSNFGGLIERVEFPSGSNGSGFFTIGLGSVGSETYTLIRRCGPQTGSATFSIAMNHNLSCRVEDCGNTTVTTYTATTTPQAGAGSGATAVPTAAMLYENTITLTTGTGTTTGAQVSVWSNTNGWMQRTPAGIEIFPMNAAAAAGAPYYPTACTNGGVIQAGALTAGGFVINATNALAASTVCLIGYRVIPDLRG